MIDDKKKKEAARQHAMGAFVSEYWQACYKEGFVDCAKWAIKESLKDLWHPASEEPENKDVDIAYLDKHCSLEVLFCERIPIENWEEEVSVYQIDKWCYKEDLLPKKGDNHD